MKFVQSLWSACHFRSRRRGRCSDNVDASLEVNPAMTNLWSTAERLRFVQAAHRRFVTLWAIHEASRLFDQQWEARQGQSLDPDQSDPQSRNWKALYRGSILDD